MSTGAQECKRQSDRSKKIFRESRVAASRKPGTIEAARDVSTYPDSLPWDDSTMVPNMVNGEASKSATARSESVGVADAVRKLRSRSPQESLGLSDSSGLLKPFLQATVITVLVLGALTAGPYLYEQAYPTPKPEKKGQPSQSDQATKPVDKPEDQNPKKTAELPKEKSKDIPPDFAKKQLGEGGVKKGEPNIDDLLNPKK